MNISDFCEKLAEYCEIESVEINETTILEDVEEYDSLLVLTIIAFADEYFEMKVSTQDFKEIVTVKDLIGKIGINKFA